MSRRKEKQRELKSDREIVAQALGIHPKKLTMSHVWALRAAYEGEASPVKDALDRIVNKVDLISKERALMKELDDIWHKKSEEFMTKSALEPLDEDLEKEWLETIDDLIDVLYDQMTA